jgi:hypothetical protein
MHDTRPAVAATQIGIITPYAKQAEKLRTLLRSQGVAVGGGGLLVGSTEQFQGLERRVIIISAVRSDPSFLQNDLQFNIGFLSNPKRCAPHCYQIGNSKVSSKEVLSSHTLSPCTLFLSASALDLIVLIMLNIGCLSESCFCLEKK